MRGALAAAAAAALLLAGCGSNADADASTGSIAEAGDGVETDGRDPAMQPVLADGGDADREDREQSLDQDLFGTLPAPPDIDASPEEAGVGDGGRPSD